MAARAAALTVTRMGAQTSTPYRTELSSLDTEQVKTTL
jgi:sugar/nucleoside kinase (ribokinase family)